MRKILFYFLSVYCLFLFNICFYDRVHQQQLFSVLPANNIHLMLPFYNTSRLGVRNIPLEKKEKWLTEKNKLFCSLTF